MTSTLEKKSLLDTLHDAYACCRDCGSKYGTYSVGCSSTWVGTCDVCKEEKPITETRDWGYLGKGIRELQSEILEDYATQSSESDEVEELYTLELTEKDVCELYAKVVGSSLFSESLENKITDLYENEIVKYELSPAAKAFVELYGEDAFSVKFDLWEPFRFGYNHAAGNHA